MKQYLRLKIIYLSFLPLLTGCHTTGNPNEGGLFGWSESKALKRQTMLIKRSKNSDLQAGKERDLTDKHLRFQQALNKETSTLETRLGRLKAENKSLHTQLLRLRQKKYVQSEMFNNLEKELKTLQKTIDLNQDILKYDPDRREGYLQNIETTNQKYKEAILFLLKY